MRLLQRKSFRGLLLAMLSTEAGFPENESAEATHPVRFFYGPGFADAAGRHWGGYRVGYRPIVSTREE